MNNSDVLRLFAQANRKCGRKEYAEMLENSAAVYEANEIIREAEASNDRKN